MAGFLWESVPQTEFDTLLDKTTSSLLPSAPGPDLPDSLQLADLIRSSAVPPLAAAKSLLRRLKDSNPNVQLLALQVLDICVKNGGTAFLLVVGAKDFTSVLEDLARGTGNREVKEKVKQEMQDWALAFREKGGELAKTELVNSYESLLRQGIEFPECDRRATAATIDSLSAPEWTDSAYCTRCRTDFSTFNRKHHCRNCGNVFDAACSSQSLALPHYGILQPVRVCDGCLRKVKDGRPTDGRATSTFLKEGRTDRRGLPERSSTVSYSSSSSSKSRHKTSRSTARRKEEEDLERAIQASLADVKARSSTDSASEYCSRSLPNEGFSTSLRRTQRNEEEWDPDLRAAIAASLRDVQEAPSAPVPSTTSYSTLYPAQTNDPYASQSQPFLPPKPPALSLPSYDLTPRDSSSLTAFSSTLLSSPSVLSYREHRLYSEAAKVVPKVEQGLMDAERRGDMLREMNEKLAEANKLYEGLLEDRVRESERRSSFRVAHQGPQPMYIQPYTTPSTPGTSASLAVGRPLPAFALSQSTLHHPPNQVYSAPPVEPLRQSHPQQQVAGYYRPSQFPSVPKGTETTLFPSVPSTSPWEKGQAETTSEVKEGELIEL